MKKLNYFLIFAALIAAPLIMNFDGRYGTALFLKSGSDIYLNNSTDDVGLGTSSPAGDLHVDGGTNVAVYLEKDETGTAKLIYRNAGADAANIQLNANEGLLFEHETSNLDMFWKVNDGGASKEIMRFDADIPEVEISNSDVIIGGTDASGHKFTVISTDTMVYAGPQAASYAAPRDVIWIGSDTLFVKVDGTTYHVKLAAGGGH